MFILRHQIRIGMLIGRKEELRELNDAFKSEYSQFVAVFGRRRVGKTFLVREAFNYEFTFQHTGVAKEKLSGQLAAFRTSLIDCGYTDCPELNNWPDAFNALKVLIKSSRKKKKVIFIDEISWMDTPKSQFVSALEHFWNGWCNARKDVLLIICASATSWIINKVIKDHGGLHNRVSVQIYLKPFTLKECEEYLLSRGIHINRYQILTLYMVMGGPAYYWSLLQKGKSAAQNIDNLFFADNGKLHGEYNALYESLFKNPERYIKIVEALGEKGIGLTRQELIDDYGLENNGLLTTCLEELEQCGFIRKYNAFDKQKKEAMFQLIDNYTLFYYKFVRESGGDPAFWMHSLNSGLYRAWSGLAFERVCLQHIDSIKNALGISGVMTRQCTWRADRKILIQGERGAQIDLLIDRKDDIVSVCEMKWASEPYVIDKDYDEKLRNKVSAFIRETGTCKSVLITMVTTFGVKDNMYSDTIQSQVVLDDLFV